MNDIDTSYFEDFRLFCFDDNLNRKFMSKTVIADRKNFEAWHRNEISILECWENFKENHDIPDTYKVSLWDFQDWLIFMGY